MRQRRTEGSAPRRNNLKQLLEAYGKEPIAYHRTILGSFQYLHVCVGMAVEFSRRPPRHYCDITGLPATYRDPRTLLYYATGQSSISDSWPSFSTSSETAKSSGDEDALGLAEFVRGLTPQRVQAYLQLRQAGTALI